MTTSVSYTAPATEPLTLREAKKHLEIAPSDNTHDDHVTSLIQAAREVWEHDTQSLTVSRTVTEYLHCWPDMYWRFYYRPVISITSINYFDSGNVDQLLASSVYSLDIGNGRFELAVEQTWPTIEERWDAITVVYVAGQSTVSEIAKAAMKFQLDILFELRGMTKDKDACTRAYECLVAKYQRSSYP